MSQIEAIGAILARAQIIEEAMRMLIVAASNNYEHPREVKGTFGKILRRFEQLYPSEEALISLLRTARDARNDAAHSDLLVAGFINELLSGEDPAAVARFQGRTVRRTIEGMDWAMRAILGFLRAHGLQVDPVASPAAVDLDETDRQTDRDGPLASISHLVLALSCPATETRLASGGMKRRDPQTLGKLAAIQGFQSLMRDHETEMKAAMAQTGRMLLPDVDRGLAVATALSRGSTPEDLAREAATRTLADLDAGRWTEAEAPLVMQGRFFTVLSAYLAVGDEASAATATSAWRQLSSPGS